MTRITIGVLGFQGDIEEHISATREALDQDSIDGSVLAVKGRDQLGQVDGLIIPGGESTVIGGMAATQAMLKEIGERARGGMPVLGTCAGLILLARRTYDRVVGETDQPLLGILDVLVERNGFGRQRESFEADLSVPKFDLDRFSGVFIRAPLIKETGKNVEVLARLGEEIVAVQQGNVLGTCFHPELSGNPIFHKQLVEMASRAH